MGLVPISLHDYAEAPGSRLVDPRQVVGVTFDWANRIEHSVGSDNWTPCWHSDNRIYACWGDGEGLDPASCTVKSSLGISRFNAFPSDGGVNRWGGCNRDHDSTWENNVADDWDTFTHATPGGTAEAKSYGLFSDGYSLWMLCGAGSLGDPSSMNVRIAQSLDASLTWTLGSSDLWVQADRMSLPSFLGYGKGGAGSFDGKHAYIYGQDWSQVSLPGLVGTKDRIYLARIPVASLALGVTASSFEYYNGLSGGQPVWSTSVGTKTEVFQDATYGFGLGTGIAYLPWLPPNGKVVMILWGLATNYGGDVTQIVRAGRLRVYIADFPWGPWTNILNTDNFQNNAATGVGLWYSQMTRKGENQAAKSVWMTYTGWGASGESSVGDWDSFGAVRATFTLQ